MSKITVGDNLKRYAEFKERVTKANQIIAELKTRAAMLKEEEARISSEVKEAGFGDGTYQGLVSFVQEQNKELTDSLNAIEKTLNEVEPLLNQSKGAV